MLFVYNMYAGPYDYKLTLYTTTCTARRTKNFGTLYSLTEGRGEVIRHYHSPSFSLSLPKVITAPACVQVYKDVII